MCKQKNKTSPFKSTSFDRLQYFEASRESLVSNRLFWMSLKASRQYSKQCVSVLMFNKQCFFLIWLGVWWMNRWFQSSLPQLTLFPIWQCLECTNHYLEAGNSLFESWSFVLSVVIQVVDAVLMSLGRMEGDCSEKIWMV